MTCGYRGCKKAATHQLTWYGADPLAKIAFHGEHDYCAEHIFFAENAVILAGLAANTIEPHNVRTARLPRDKDAK